MSELEVKSDTHQDRVQVLLQAVRSGLAENLTRGLRVGGSDSDLVDASPSQENEPTSFKQEAFAKACGKSRATISSILAGNDPANPDLSTLCALAATLNVSTAFLLMTRDDWSRIIQAVSTVLEIYRSDNTKLQVKLMELFDQYPIATDTAVNRAKLGFDVAKQLGLYEEKSIAGSKDDEEARESIEQARAVISHDSKEKMRSLYVGSAMANPGNKTSFQVAVIMGAVAIPYYKPER